MNYADKHYWQEHPVIRFDILYEQGEFEVMVTFYDREYSADDDCFKFYRFVKVADKADYENAIRNYKEKSIYDTGVTAEYGVSSSPLSPVPITQKTGGLRWLPGKENKAVTDRRIFMNGETHGANKPHTHFIQVSLGGN